MTHYILLKLADDADVDAVEARVRKTYAALDAALDCLHDPKVYRSCVDRGSNATLMAVIQLDDVSCLQTYLTHPLHVQMAENLSKSIVGKMSFDHA